MYICALVYISMKLITIKYFIKNNVLLDNSQSLEESLTRDI